jgi:hypothetical protein
VILWEEALTQVTLTQGKTRCISSVSILLIANDKCPLWISTHKKEHVSQESMASGMAASRRSSSRNLSLRHVAPLSSGLVLFSGCPPLRMPNTHLGAGM